MRRRDVISFFAGAVVAWPFAAIARPTDRTETLARVKRAYDKISHPTELARSHYLTMLVRMREKAVRDNGDWQAIDAEIKQHPAPADSDGAAFTRLRIGDWESPRHDYRYRSDGSWTMLPVEDGITNGSWRIEGNRCFETVSLDPPVPSQFTIILLTGKDFVFTDDAMDVFYETRLT